MVEAIEREAACTCGDFRLRLRGEPQFVSSCCCTRCQRRTGSFFGVTVYFAPDQLAERSGDEALYRRPNDEGGETVFHFCPRCGSNLWWESIPSWKMFGVAGGCFADTSLPAPQRMVYTRTRHPFVCTPPGLPIYLDGVD